MSVTQTVIQGDGGMTPLKAPFRYFGGKSTVAAKVWERFGNVPNYVEPFGGSLAVLLGRPHAPKYETVNELDGLVTNVWRALKYAPNEVAAHADWIISELDLHARHGWLIEARERLTERLRADPDFYDAKAAGWWLWGSGAWVGGGWGALGHKRRPHLWYPCGVHAISRDEWHARFAALSTRLRDTRICCGDWARVLGHFVTTGFGVTAVFLDPPYCDDKRDVVYGEDSFTVGHEVAAWAIENGDDPLFRIAVCGYEGSMEFPATWDCVEWKAQGGYANKGDGEGKKNRHRERIWFSPHCLPPAEQRLF